MALPVVEIIGKKIILLSGYQKREKPAPAGAENGSVIVRELQQLQQSAIKNPDAVAFGYTAGGWMPAA